MAFTELTPQCPNICDADVAFQTKRQDPQVTLSVTEQETGESWASFSEQTFDSIASFKLKEANDKDYIDVKPRTPEGSHRAGDYILWTQETHEDVATVEKSFDSSELIPVINLKPMAYEEPKPMEGYLYASVIDHKVQYDKSTEQYHLWYFIWGWTHKDPEATSPGPTSVRDYNCKKAKIFDPEDFHVVRQRNYTELEMPCAAKVLMHATGFKVTLREDGGTAERPFLVTEAPEVVAYWPLKCIFRSSSSRSSSSPESSSSVESSSSIQSSSVSKSVPSSSSSPISSSKSLKSSSVSPSSVSPTSSSESPASSPVSSLSVSIVSSASPESLSRSPIRISKSSSSSVSKSPSSVSKSESPVSSSVSEPSQISSPAISSVSIQSPSAVSKSIESPSAVSKSLASSPVSQMSMSKSLESISPESKVSESLGSESPQVSSISACPPFSGCITIVCDASFDPKKCELTKERGKIVVENGLVCENSGCDEDPCEDDMGMMMAYHGAAQATLLKRNNAAIVLPEVTTDSRAFKWLKDKLRLPKIKWGHVITNGEIDQTAFENLVGRGVRVHTVPNLGPERIATVLEILCKEDGIELMAVWDGALETLPKLPAPRVLITENPKPLMLDYDYVIATSAWIRDRLPNKLKSMATSVLDGITVNEHLPIRGRRTVREEMGIPKTAKVVVYIYKGPDQNRLTTQGLTMLPEDWHIIFPQYVGGLERVVKTFGERVHVAAQNTKIGDLLGASDVLLYEGYEGFPTEVLAAFVGSTSAVLLGDYFTEIDHRTTVAGHDTNLGIIAPPNEPSTIAKAIRDAYESPEMHAVRKKNATFVWEETSGSKVGGRWDRALRSIINEWWGTDETV